MSQHDRRSERLVADHYNESVRQPDEPPAPRRFKRFGEGLLTGFAIGSVFNKLFK